MEIYKQIVKKMLLVIPILLTGCDWITGEVPLPEVNEENCKPENVNRVRDVEARNKFINKCVLRSTVKPSKPRGW